ncbi:3-alpha,7-alpha,12-alpha-trihydroxy-5-beta-cholest-24-enoyl-CoA hydratase [Pseudomonas capeferrum]|uniref:MaoC/PaaZ C-terminal domain-containing protein n=1 Tax=Pseudomonas capeferrum TaxID=1495066 RepID=UPI0015E41D9E|nr:MaoC/PaaZ C-terminal domain-containing protein [Pseudomonas capeferrum]MBA1204264.1 3-alpha,7-alpha,12-alpha-trihydroxy-5-beta-cholest-24-enoyl-CoA hydratase [Pseudomonas capeferrum]
MAIDYEKLLDLQIPDTQQSYTHKDSILYALSLGYASDPIDARQLPLVYEEGLQAVPTMGVVLAHPGYWPRTLNTGLDWVRIVHAEQGLTLHKQLPAEAQVIGKSRVVQIIDKGADKGALITYERRILERATGEPLCTITQTMLARGDGGFGGPQQSIAPPPGVPERPADYCVDLSTPANMALLYRLNGDWNPLHADPDIARKAGFERPILHGLATWGVAGRAIMQAVCGFDGNRIASIFGRFTAPAYPGETFRSEIWVDGTTVAFRVRAVERDVIVINNGRVELRV